MTIEPLILGLLAVLCIAAGYAWGHIEGSKDGHIEGYHEGYDQGDIDARALDNSGAPLAPSMLIFD